MPNLLALTWITVCIENSLCHQRTVELRSDDHCDQKALIGRFLYAAQDMHRSALWSLGRPCQPNVQHRRRHLASQMSETSVIQTWKKQGLMLENAELTCQADLRPFSLPITTLPLPGGPGFSFPGASMVLPRDWRAWRVAWPLREPSLWYVCVKYGCGGRI